MRDWTCYYEFFLIGNIAEFGVRSIPVAETSIEWEIIIIEELRY